MLTCTNVLKTSPASDIHKIVVAATENAVVIETWRLGGQLSSSHPSNFVFDQPNSRWNVTSGRILASQLGSKIQALISELSELVQLPCPTAADLSLDGLCKWAPDEVVDKAIATVAALQPGDRASLERLGENWSEQLLLEEGFLNAVYHHLQYTLYMIWDHIQKLLEDVADDVEDLQHKYKKRLQQMLTVSRSFGTDSSSSKYAGLVAYNSYCVSTGLPVFENGERRVFEDFCSHWKENHRILVQRRMVWESMLGGMPEPRADSVDGNALNSTRSVRGSPWEEGKHSDEEAFDEDDIVPRGSARSNGMHGRRGSKARSDAADRDFDDMSSQGGGADKPDAAEAEHIRLLKFVRDTQVWATGKRYCEIRAEQSWMETMDSLTTQVGKRAQEIRRLEEGLEAGRFEHLDREFQERVHALRVEENALKARLRERAELDENLERCCVALRRQRKPIRQQIHRTILLRYVQHVAPVVNQVRSKLEAVGVAEDNDGDEDDHGGLTSPPTLTQATGVEDRAERYQRGVGRQGDAASGGYKDDAAPGDGDYDEIRRASVTRSRTQDGPASSESFDATARTVAYRIPAYKPPVGMIGAAGLPSPRGSDDEY